MCISDYHVIYISELPDCSITGSIIHNSVRCAHCDSLDTTNAYLWNPSVGKCFSKIIPCIQQIGVAGLILVNNHDKWELYALRISFSWLDKNNSRDICCLCIYTFACECEYILMAVNKRVLTRDNTIGYTRQDIVLCEHTSCIKS
jgi:hypothetical protein